MALSYDLISQFAKLAAGDKKTSTESTVYGNIVEDENGDKYVRLDGSDQLIPLSTDERSSINTSTANANPGERVSVTIKNHTATVTGNVSSPSARKGDVDDLEDEVTRFEIAVGDQIQANEAYFKKLIADDATIGELIAAEINVTQLIADLAKIKEMIADKITVTDLIATKIDADVVVADKAIVEELKAKKIDVLSLIADTAVIEDLIANNADITSLEAQNAYLRYATVDFANIGEAAIRKLFSDSGLIRDLVVGDQTITGELVGVTILGDLIKAGTLVADKLVVRGSDGNYYKLNTDFSAMPGVEPIEEDSIHGSTIVAKSVTAEKVSVHDLVAFGATIGGFEITDHSINSFAKDSVENPTRGIYFDNEGQMSIGDGNQFLKYHLREEGSAEVVDEVLVITERNTGLFSTSISDNALYISGSESYTPYVEVLVGDSVVIMRNNSYTLDISVDSVTLGRRGKTVDDALDDVDDGLNDYRSFVSKFSKYIRFMEDENGNPSDTAMTIGSGDSTITLEIDNIKGLVFKKNGNEFGSWDGTNFHTGNIKIDVEQRAQLGNFAFVPRSDGSLSFLKVGG